MAFRTLFTLTLAGLGLLGLSTNARADFLVLCPTGGVAGIWEHTSGTSTTSPHPVPLRRELIVTPTRVLRCSGDLNPLPTFSYNSNTCGGTVEFVADSAVFGRTEFFSNGPKPAFATISSGVCTLTAPSTFVIMSMTMSRSCTSLRSGLGWSCPDDAVQVSAP